MANCSSSSSRAKSDEETPRQQVFINFRGVELRYNFVSHLDKCLKRNGINSFIDTDEEMGQRLDVLLTRIEGSKIALAIFSPKYTESNWCLKELVKINERMEQSKLVVIPIFYKVEPVTVKELKGEFGDKFRELVKSIDKKTKKKWKEALKSVPLSMGFVLTEKRVTWSFVHSDEDETIVRIVKEVKRVLSRLARAFPNARECSRPSLQRDKKSHESSWGIEHRLEQLEEKLCFGFEESTRTIGVVGMPGIGKTTLTRKLYEQLNNGFLSHVLIEDIHEISKECGLSYLPKILLDGLLIDKNPNAEAVQAAHEAYKEKLLETKVFVVLDNVSSKEQINALLGKRDWIKRGSKIVIATSDKSLIQNLVDDTFEVPRLSDRDALQHFIHYAFDHQAEDDALERGKFSKLSNDFVHYTKGNPLALKILGAELLGKDKTHWESKLAALTQHHKSPPGQSTSKMLHNLWKGSYDGLRQHQKDTLLDVACFKSLEDNYVTSLLDSDGANNEIDALVNKFMINIYAGKVEMHDTLYILSKELGREATATDGKGRHRLWHHHAITTLLEKNKKLSFRHMIVSRFSFARSDEDELIKRVVKEVKKVLMKTLAHASPNPQKCIAPSSPPQRNQKSHESSWGIEQRLKQLEEKLSHPRYKETTRIIGVVGMPGIGKTTLVTKLYEKLKNEFVRHVFIKDIHNISEGYGLNDLPTILLEDLLKVKNPIIGTLPAAHAAYKDQLLKTKVLVVLDNVSNKEQIDVLLGERDWIAKGSKIVISTTDISLTHNLVSDIYEVPPLSDRDALQHFIHYAFDDQEDIALGLGIFSKLLKDFVHYTKGNPLALRILGRELSGKDETIWESKLAALTQHHNSPPGKNASMMLQRVWKGTYDGLSQNQKDTLLDIACFRSLDENYVASLLDAHGPCSSDARNVDIADLVNKFMINISSGKVEMHDTLYMLSKELGQDASALDGKGRRRLWHHHTIIDVIDKNKGASKLRSILLDLSEVKRKTSFQSQAFAGMSDLRYLKIYSSKCPQECDRDNKLNFPDGLQLPLSEVRCLHWLKFPLKEVPEDFNPENLVDLKLPYSEIERVWEDNKDASKLRWVDLNHSRKLSILSGLGKAQSIEYLNLEGCTALTRLHENMEDMKCLVFLNLRGCTSLKSLPLIKLISLKTLILSGCSKFKAFHVISDKLEALYLDGTKVNELPVEIGVLQRLVLLNMKDCKKLKKLPCSLRDLEALEQLILSGCSKLKEFLETGGHMSSLQILLLDGTAIKDIPDIFSVRRLCLSWNVKISRLPDLISRFLRLQSLDLKHCKNLTHVPQLPPNLQCLDVRGCSSLKTIAKPLVCSVPTGQIHSKFIFTNCNELEKTAKEEIAAYAERKCQLVSSALKRCNGGCVPDIVFDTSFPGCEMPSWFCHEAIGSLVEFELPPHWDHNRLSGIVLCVVVSFKNCQDHADMTVKFTGEGSCTSITWKVGSLIEQDNEVDTVESDHVLIGYTTNCLNFRKLLQCHDPRKCAPTKASLEFSVTTGTGGEASFEVLRSGFSFVFEPEEIKVPPPRSEQFKGKTKNNGTLDSNGSFKDQPKGHESPKGHFESCTGSCTTCEAHCHGH
ncbi:hypothetical protein F2Q69_00044628 [Brassica cretica]|uniref:ADP-ribosyl cyclase/cyclic ADP-ribose hydrolase n=1 Tax=Brassica cretica TaxID=69181 RepID=A0A8S9NKN4_BRACR|nr:hypothetical protein F2Q69_00044628 [Brassica cretica]